MNQHAKIDIRHSTCPHDCPSACALDVEVIDGRTIGRVRGSKVQTYTAGVVCAKVARYAERIHHPEDRKSTRLNSSHVEISYAVFCLKKKKNTASLFSLLQKKKITTKIK